MTDSHNSGQHKDREAAAAEVRRMWQPTPSWSQPDPNQDADVEAAETDEKPDALSPEFQGDSWSRQSGQQAPWTQPQTPPPAQPPTPSWTQPASESTGSWTQPAAEADDLDEKPETDAPEEQGDDEADNGTTPPAAQGPAANTPVFGGSSFHGSGSGQSGPRLRRAVSSCLRLPSTSSRRAFLASTLRSSPGSSARARAASGRPASRQSAASVSSREMSRFSKK